MIGRLRGEVAFKSVEGAVIDVGGVGYDVRCPLTVVDRLPRVGEACTLSIHTHVREDQLVLYGFNNDDERALFRALTAVSGIGPKLALACLGGMDADTLTRAIVDEDIKRLSTIPGVGKRTAERIALELHEKLRGHVSTAARPEPLPDHLSDLESALRNLGYKPRDVEKLVEGLRAQAEGMDFEALLREALKRMST